MERGFTLIETIIVVALTAVVGVGLLTMIAYVYRSNAYVLEGTSAVSSARRGLHESFAALREATYGEDGAYPLASAATSSVTFYSDRDKDASVEKVRLYLSNGTLYEGVTDPAGNPQSYAGQPETTRTIATYVRNTSSTPIFRYFDASGTALVAPVNLASVRSVQVHLEVDLNPLRAPEIVTLEAGATVRNLR